MLIDPFTIIAQIVNFVILAWALKYFLYDRVIKAMDEREAGIADRLNKAEQREAAAATELAEYQASNAEIGRDRHTILEQVHTEANQNRQRLLAHSRSEVEAERQRWLTALQAEKQQFERELHRRTADEVIELSRRALSDLAGADIEVAVIRLGLQNLAAEQANEARGGLFGHEEVALPMTVRTAFAVGPEQRTLVVEKIRAMGDGVDREVRFETDPSLILGIEFRSDDTSVGWNANDYLDQLDSRVAELAASLDRRVDGG